MIDLYTWGTPNGQKISIALEELDLPYRVIPVDIKSSDRFAPQFLRISPNNKIPAIVDNETSVTLMESGAILLYLAEKTGRLIPSDLQDRWQTHQWLMWQMSGFGPSLGQAHHFMKLQPGKAPYATEHFRAETLRLYEVLERRLSEAEYLSSTYTIADIAIWPWVARFAWQDVDLGNYPSVLAWYRRIANRSAVQRGYRIPDKDLKIPYV